MNLTEALIGKFPECISSLTEWQSINCPLHADENKSAGLNFELKLFKCFASCGVLNFRHLAEKLELEYDGVEGEQFDTDWLQLLGAQSTPPKRTLRQQAKEYTQFLLEKGIKPETIEAFGGRYEANQNSQDYGYLLIPYGKDKTERRRIIKSVGDNRFEQRKGTSKTLFGQHIASHNTVILVEGITDYLSLWQSGYKNVVASFGAQVSKQQMYELRGKTVFILFDRDYAGYEGTHNAFKLLKEFKANPIILEIPKHFGNTDDKIDPNSAMLHSPMEFCAWLTEQTTRYNLFDTDYINSIFLANKGIVKYIPTNIPSWDGYLNGGLATGLHAIAGMPEAGKSTLITHLIDQFYSVGQKVLAMSYELTKEQIYSRLASRHTDCSWSDIEKDHNEVNSEATKYLKDISEYVRIDNSWTMEEIKAAANNFDVIIVDYIQRTPYEGDDERAGIKKNARELSNLTRDGKVVILISSIPRSMYDKTGKNVFKETGDIEYICQSGYILSKVTADIAHLRIIKNTRGKSDQDIYLRMNYAHQRITETTRPDIGEMIGN